jgi:hypothetical protein
VVAATLPPLQRRTNDVAKLLEEPSRGLPSPAETYPV